MFERLTTELAICEMYDNALPTIEKIQNEVNSYLNEEIKYPEGYLRVRYAVFIEYLMLISGISDFNFEKSERKTLSNFCDHTGINIVNVFVDEQNRNGKHTYLDIEMYKTANNKRLVDIVTNSYDIFMSPIVDNVTDILGFYQYIKTSKGLSLLVEDIQNIIDSVIYILKAFFELDGVQTESEVNTVISRISKDINTEILKKSASWHAR